MENKHIGVYALAKALDVRPVTITRWLQGTYEPRHANLIKLVNSLEVTADYLCGTDF